MPRVENFAALLNGNKARLVFNRRKYERAETNLISLQAKRVLSVIQILVYIVYNWEIDFLVVRRATFARGVGYGGTCAHWPGRNKNGWC